MSEQDQEQEREGDKNEEENGEGYLLLLSHRKRKGVDKKESHNWLPGHQSLVYRDVSGFSFADGPT